MTSRWGMSLHDKQGRDTKTSLGALTVFTVGSCWTPAICSDAFVASVPAISGSMLGKCDYVLCRMVRELRFAHWEAQEQLPRMGRPKSHAAEAASGQQQNKRHWQTFKQWQGPEAPDLAAGLLHQKLQMLNCCTFLRRHPEAGFVIAPAVTRQQPAQTTAAASGQGIDRADAGAAGGSSNSGLAQEVRRLVRKSKDSGAAGPSEDAGDGGSAAASDTDYASCCDDLAAAADVDAAAEGFAEPMEDDADVLYPSFELRLPSPVTSDMVAEREAALAALGACTPPPFCVCVIMHCTDTLLRLISAIRVCR